MIDIAAKAKRQPLRIAGRVSPSLLVVWTLVCAPSLAETLEEAWEAGIAADQRLEASRCQTMAVQRGLLAAQAERWASIDASVQYYGMDKSVSLAVASPLMGTAPLNVMQREGLIAGVHVTQPLYTFGRIQNAIHAADADVYAALSSESEAELDVLLRVATAYIGVLRTQRRVEVASRAVESLRSHTRDVTNLVLEGIRIRKDQLAAELALSNAKQDLLEAQSGLAIARATYNRTVGRCLDTPVYLVELPEPLGAYNLEDLTQMALASRPEISVLSARGQSLRSRAQQVRAEYRPQFSVRGGFDFIENRYLTDGAFSWLMLVGQWNLFDGGKKHGMAEKSELSAEGILRQRADVESVIRLQVRDACLNLETTRELVRVNREGLHSAEENLRVAKTRYDQGVGTNTEVLDAETLRTRTFNRHYQSVYDAVQALMQLSRVVGDFSIAGNEFRRPGARTVSTDHGVPRASAKAFRRLPRVR